MWDLLIDDQQKYHFEVVTNFSHSQLETIQKQIEQSEVDKTEIDLVLNKYGNESFFATNERFNSAIVFESHQEINDIEQSY